MNKIINIVILLMLVLFISFRITTACSQMNQVQQNSDPIEELPVTYTGLLPCDDCPGIVYYLHLDDGIAREVKLYRNGYSEPSVWNGLWSLREDTLRIKSMDEGHVASFLYSKQNLILIERDSFTVPDSERDLYQLERSPEETTIRQRHRQLRKEGIRFVASGNEPFWYVHSDLKNKILYRTPETERTVAKPRTERINGAMKLAGESEPGNIELTITDTFCSDTMSGFLFTHTVTLLVDNELEMDGCGMFLD